MATGGVTAASVGSKESAAEQQRKLIAVIKSSAPPKDKAIACKRLAIYGTEDAVPALAPLLADQELASWARIALEAIPGPAADAALRKAVSKLHGRLLIGTINSIGVRRDLKAIGDLVPKLKDGDPEVASASAVALGRIGGTKAARALEQSLASASVAVRPAIAEGCVLCAEQFSKQGNLADAVKLYDQVRTANVPKHKILEATRGAILARQSAGLPLLLEQLRSSDPALVGIGLRTARELPGREVTEALAAELDRCPANRQAFLLLAVADRHDPAAMPAILKAAEAGPTQVRLVAVGVLDRLGNPSSVPVLLRVAADGETELKAAALAALVRLPGNEIDADICSRLSQATGKTRQTLIEVAAQRRIQAALPTIVSSAQDTDPAVRCAAVQAVGVLGHDREATDLVRLLQNNQGAKERADIETALVALSSRSGSRCVPNLLPLEQSDDPSVRIIGLHVLASAGGPDALAAVKSALGDKDESVQDEAVRTLSTWPNNWPEDNAVAEPLLALARDGKKNTHQVLGLRGYLQYIQGDKQLRNNEKPAKVKDVMPLIKRPEEQRLAIAILGAVPNASALELLMAFAAEPAVANDACSAVVRLAEEKMTGVSRDERRQALQTVVAKSTSDDTKRKARELLKKSE
jgi:HEAT repeat protein